MEVFAKEENNGKVARCTTLDAIHFATIILPWKSSSIATKQLFLAQATHASVVVYVDECLAGIKKMSKEEEQTKYFSGFFGIFRVQ